MLTTTDQREGSNATVTMLPQKDNSGENVGQEWYLKVQKDLLNLKVTRSASLKLQSNTMDTLEQAMVMRK